MIYYPSRGSRVKVTQTVFWSILKWILANFLVVLNKSFLDTRYSNWAVGDGTNGDGALALEAFCNYWSSTGMVVIRITFLHTILYSHRPIHTYGASARGM